MLRRKTASFCRQYICSAAICFCFIIGALSTILLMTVTSNVMNINIQKVNDFKAQNPKDFLCASICDTFFYKEDYQGVECCFSASSHFYCMTKQECFDITLAGFQDNVDKNTSDYNIQVGFLIAFIAGAAIVIFILFRRWKRFDFEDSEQSEDNIENLIQEPVQPEPIEKIHHNSFLHKDIENKCAICLQSFNKEKAIRLLCKHIFHSKCCRDWLAEHPTCPICRARN